MQGAKEGGTKKRGGGREGASLTSPPSTQGTVLRLRGHRGSVMTVQWMGGDSPSSAMPGVPGSCLGTRFVASAGEDERLIVWDTLATGGSEAELQRSATLFVHAGHRCVRPVPFASCSARRLMLA